MPKMNLTVIEHYSKEDPDCSGDYHTVDIATENGVLRSYGDYYHDKGQDKVAGFLDALRLLNVLGNVRYTSVADSDL